MKDPELKVLDLLLRMQDVSVYSWGRTVTLRIRHTWEFLQSFEFRHKREKLMHEMLKKEKSFDLVIYSPCSWIIWEKLKCILHIKVLFLVKYSCICVFALYKWLALWNTWAEWMMSLHTHPPHQPTSSAGIAFFPGPSKIPLYMDPRMYVR